ncbi:glycosyltransferase family 4 protein [Allomuricauda sp. F6463D]|uniref:glycosyltransferase family 4 protein n=1 Tax=Allomuricauda sp. F6463D TaxID=2926409 RepID=UPI001FF29A8A|nr:glycosyltransferase family 1 protein [Muricauda sp. F6463D]MCK0161191.1 glycosyltransferase family 4 protein [Muricauda sp. F6463D]
MIVINAKFLTQKITGVQRFALELCKRLPRTIQGEEVVFVSPKAEQINVISTDVQPIQFGRLPAILWEQIELPIFLKRNGNPLLINLAGVGPVLYKNKIMALYDLAYEHHPEWFTYSFHKVYSTLIPIGLKNSKRIVTDSNYVKDDIIETYKIEDNKIEVIYAAPSEMFRDKGLKREKFILTVSSIDPRKNLKSVIQAYKQLDTDYKLVIVGKSNHIFSNLDLEEEMGDSNINFTGYLSDKELIELYNKAEIFIYASFFEGFGMPPLEAQACGCCCIVSNKTSLPEVYQDSVHYCEPTDLESIKSAMKNLIENPELRIQLRDKGFENLKRFSWDNSTEQLKQIIKDIL